jgi:hypothetical protein
MLADLTCRGILLRLLLLALLIGTSGAVAQPLEIWRYFTSGDGLVESWAGAVSTGPGGLVWITHGQVPEMSTYDGFSVKHLPSPGIDTRVEEGPGGEPWAMEIQPGHSAMGLKLFSGGKWTFFPVSDFAAPDPELLVTASGAQRFRPIGKGHVLYVAKDGLREFDSAAAQSRAIRALGCAVGDIRSLASARPSGLWIAGERGIARISQLPSADASVSCVPWGRGVPPGLKPLQQPVRGWRCGVCHRA